MSLHSDFISKLTYEEAFKRIFSTDTISKLKLLSKDSNMSLCAYLRYMINELYDLKFNSKVGAQ